MAADDYEGLSPTFAAACRAADAKQRRKPADARIKRLRALMADEVTLERAYAEVSKPEGVAASTLEAAEFLVRAGAAERLRQWLAQHTPEQRRAIHQHLKAKQWPSSRP